jgi:anti-anti-sigma factor
MLLELDREWSLELDRGPDWLYMHLRPPNGKSAAEAPLAERICQQLEQSFCYRVVLELDDVPAVRSWMLNELVRLQKRVEEKGGTLRLCGLSPTNEAALKACHLLDHFPAFANRHDAVMGCRPKPR